MCVYGYIYLLPAYMCVLIFIVKKCNLKHETALLARVNIGRRNVFVLPTLRFAIAATIHQFCILYEPSYLHCKYSPRSPWERVVIRCVLIQKGMCSYVEINLKALSDYLRASLVAPMHLKMWKMASGGCRVKTKKSFKSLTLAVPIKVSAELDLVFSFLLGHLSDEARS